MKILLNKPFSAYEKLIVPPMGLAYIASYLEKKGHRVKIVDSSAYRQKNNILEKEFKKFDPDVLGVTSTSMTLFNAIKTVDNIKKQNPNCLTILGGPHPTVRPKHTLKSSENIDVIVRGEGEITFSELINSFERKDKKDFSKIKGITFKKNDKIIQTEERKLIQDLDSLPFPAYHLLPMDKYKYWDRVFSTLAIKKNSIPFSYILTSRGCPYNCAFCSSRVLWGNKWRSRNPEDIIEELKILKDKYKRKIIDVIDDTFTIDKQRVIKICNLIKQEKLDMSYVCTTRTDLFDRNIASSLKEAGFFIVFFGFESGVQKTLNYLCKGFTLNDTINTVKIAKEEGLKIGSNFIIGIPGETKKDINKTINFARKLNLDYTSFTILIPFPGTKIYKDAKKDGLILNERWEEYTYRNFYSLMKVPGFSNKSLKGLWFKSTILCNFTPLRFLKNLFYEFPSRGFE